ncbi:MAG TPA: class I SAM-dependent methyltransferase, partial [Solirubrobacteraceae bacterium]|nr:class I SAM-dependent methyltransferase [Solirubrobacteraceae bacterium]
MTQSLQLAHLRERMPSPSRALVLALLRATRHGTLEIVEGEREWRFGRAVAGGPSVRVVVHDRRLYRALLRASLGLSRAYSEGWFDCPDLPELARLAALNMAATDRWRRALRPLVALPSAAGGWLARNTPARARRRIAAHYDLGNDLFSLMLDETMTYSCAVFEHAGMSLAQAQRAKHERLCRLLGLGPADHVLEIGCGWGG